MCFFLWGKFFAFAWPACLALACAHQYPVLQPEQPDLLYDIVSRDMDGRDNEGEDGRGELVSTAQATIRSSHKDHCRLWGASKPSWWWRQRRQRRQRQRQRQRARTSAALCKAHQ